MSIAIATAATLTTTTGLAADFFRANLEGVAFAVPVVLVVVAVVAVVIVPLVVVGLTVVTVGSGTLLRNPRLPKAFSPGGGPSRIEKPPAILDVGAAEGGAKVGDVGSAA